ncbi:MAG: hypothetical protein WCP79_03120 [Bacillota bacterium]
MEKFFTTEGPIQPDIHYYVPMLEQFHSHEVTTLIDKRKYFLMHAPRQTGKTSSLFAYANFLNEQGKYKCLLPDKTIQKEVIESKILRGSLQKTLTEALPQTADYMDKSGVTNGSLLIFDRTAGKSRDEKIFIREEQVGDKRIRVYGM